MKNTPMLFGETFYNISKLDKDIRDLPKGYNSIFERLFGEVQNQKESELCNELIKRSESIPVFEDKT